MACSYAILSWADIVVALEDNLLEKKKFIEKMKQTKRIKSSEQCMLSCSYAQYIMGEKESLGEIFEFLKSKNYRIRCATLNLMRDILNDENIVIIRKEVENMLDQEDALAVRDTAKKLLKKL